MVSTTLVVLVVAVTVIAVVWRIAGVRRCPCQREEPLAGLGALGAVTARVRRRQDHAGPREEPAARPPLRPVPHPARSGRADLRRHPGGRHPVHTRPRH